MSTEEQLIEILLDPKAPLDERDDAAMALVRFPEERAVKALAFVASNLSEVNWLRDTCGESIAFIWLQLDRVDIHIYNNLTNIAKETIVSVLTLKKSHLLGQINTQQ